MSFRHNMSDEEKVIYDRQLRSYNALLHGSNIQDFVEYMAFSSTLHIMEARRAHELRVDLARDSRREARDRAKLIAELSNSPEWTKISSQTSILVCRQFWDLLEKLLNA